MKRLRQDVLPLPPWRSEQLYFSAKQWFADLLRDIDAAQYSICLQTYIFVVDSIGDALLKALCRASQRGVDVRVIVDGIGSSESIDFLQKMLHGNRAELHVYHPLPWHWAATRLERGDWLTRFIERLARMNNRQHSKLCLIDGDVAWTGSFNITDDHIENNGRGMDWKDCGARVTGERCILLSEFFNAVWLQDKKHFSAYFLLHPVTNFSPLLRRRRLRIFLQQIHAARHRIWITSAYFSPIPSIVRALKKASRRGVDVQVMVPEHSDVRFFPALASTYYVDLLRAGILIHEYEDGILHDKHMVIDNAVTVGSSNMNHRSALHDVELDIELFSQESVDIMVNDFQGSLQKCRNITLKNISRFYMWLLILGRIPRLLRYWL
ncbi:MAG TPA: phospholipase D-like domain-containing protein [Pseudomonadales bacterium]|nr:phospholipase D-like domain-containing protein [Pseudomonadales bacterium]